MEPVETMYRARTVERLVEVEVAVAARAMQENLVLEWSIFWELLDWLGSDYGFCEVAFRALTFGIF